MIGLRPGNAADQLAFADAPEDLLDSLRSESPPVALSPDLQSRVAEDAWRPVERMDLRHQRDVHEAGCPVELLVLPVRKLPGEMIADRVVLLGEQVVHEAEPDPPVCGQACPLQSGIL